MNFIKMSQGVNPVPFGIKKIKKIVDDAILADNKEKYPVGRIFISTFNINPEFYLGFGTWIAWGEGRFRLKSSYSPAALLSSLPWLVLP